jgi:hypothetical protein
MFVSKRVRDADLASKGTLKDLPLLEFVTVRTTDFRRRRVKLPKLLNIYYSLSRHQGTFVIRIDARGRGSRLSGDRDRPLTGGDAPNWVLAVSEFARPSQAS